MDKHQISLIINCNKDDISKINIDIYKSQYSKIYFNFNNNLENILKQLDTDYYDTCDYSASLNVIDNINRFTNNYNIEISILIPVYNCEETIKDCIYSCLIQDFEKKYEIVIIDDGSTDDTINIIKSFKYDIIKLYSKEHSGISDTLNFGLTKCHGKYICRMDADDIMLNNRLSIQYDCITNKELHFICGNINRIFDNNKDNENIEISNKFLSIDDFNKIGYNFIVHPTFCFSKDLYQNIINRYGYFYDSLYNGAEDYELLLRLLNDNYQIYIDDNIILNYYVKEKTNDYITLQNHLCNKLNYQYDVNNIKQSHIGIYYISTGIYNNSFNDFLLSLNNFFPGVKKTIILLSDQLNKYDNYIDDINNINIKYVYLQHQMWPMITLFKMTTILENKGNYDYVFYFNANSILLKSDYSWFKPNQLILTYHKDWFGNDCKTYKFLEPFNDNPNSTAYIGTTNYTYVQGAFFGGNAKLVYDMCEVVTEMLQEDLINNIIPRWHDESYLNKYAYLMNYEKCGKINIENVLISEIFYDINNLNNIKNTQFIILKENIYNRSENNKLDKFSKLIPYQYLKPLYNYENIFDYKDKYPINNYVCDNNSNISLICIYLTNELSEETFNLLYKLMLNIDFSKYKILIYFDSRNPFLQRLHEINNSNIYVFDYDIIHIITQLNKIEYPYKMYEYLDFMYINILYLIMYEKINNLNIQFKYIYIFHERFINEILKVNNICNNLNYYDNNIKCDLYSINKSISKSNLLEFNQNQYTKQFNLFKYKFRNKTHLYMDYDAIIRLSYNALTYLHNVKTPLKNEIGIYSIPTILYNDNFIIKDKNNEN